MKRWIASIVLITLITAAHAVVAQQPGDEEQRALRARLAEQETPTFNRWTADAPVCA